MNKIKFVPILTIILLLCFSITMFAAPDGLKSPTKIITYKASEISDIDKLFERAQKGISDIPKEKFARPTYTLKNVKNNIVKKGTSYVTTQLLEVSTDGNVTTNEYATTTISIVPSTSLSEDNLTPALSTSKKRFSIMADYTRGDYDWDSTGGIRAYSTIYWSTTLINGLEYCRLTRVSGGWNSYDGTITMSNRHVLYGQEGVNSSGLPINPQGDLYPTSNFYDKSVNYDWINCQGVAYYSLGNSTDVKLTKASSTWYLYHYNHHPND